MLRASSAPGVPRLGIPEIWCTDGPHGIRPEVLWDEWEQAGWTLIPALHIPPLPALQLHDRTLPVFMVKA